MMNFQSQRQIRIFVYNFYFPVTLGLVPEVLRGQCPGCDRNVKTQVRRVMSHVQRNFPQQWSEVMNRFIHRVQNPGQSFQNVFGR